MLINDKGGHMQSLQKVIADKITFYKKSGISKAEALTKIINKLIKSRYSGTTNLASDTGMSPELFLKLDKTGTMTMEEAMKTLQLKKEIDCLIEQRI